MKQSWLLVLCLTGITMYLPAQIGTTFSEPAPSSTPYTDTGNPDIPHPLSNNGGQMPLNHPYNEGELGFEAHFIPTRSPSVGLTDGDLCGITDSPSIFLDEPGTGGWLTSDQGLEIEDTDGKLQILFTEVDLASTSNPVVSVDFYLSSTGYEESSGVMDNFRIYCRMDGGAFEIDLLNTNGQDIDDMGIEGSWLTLNQVLPVGNSAQLIIEVDFNSNAEELFIDQIQFSEGTALPVEWLGFAAFAEYESEAGIRLEWQTATETNSDYFEVERSSDGQSFKSIGQLPAAGESYTVKSYRFTDSRPINGWNYYRLKQMDIDGRFSYSEIRAIEWLDSGISFFPSPLSGNDLFFQGNTFSGQEVAFYNVRGEWVFSAILQSESSLDVSQLPPGMYWLISEGKMLGRILRL
ncbi:MAG: T9SS type A sorting domain-containing protein [Bacteroidetes bacterium]|nr:T9SS type A sorting domain-containing protein [Bacteroidota bacterium]